jgi:hypothetical protein
MNVKSFLRGWAKLFTIVRVFVPDPVPTLVVYRQSLAMSRIICGKARDNLAKALRANYSAKAMQSQGIFAGIVQINPTC